MNGKISLNDLPFEIQKKIMDLLGEKDHVSMHRVSKSWQCMVSEYLRNVLNLIMF